MAVIHRQTRPERSLTILHGNYARTGGRGKAQVLALPQQPLRVLSSAFIYKQVNHPAGVVGERTMEYPLSCCSGGNLSGGRDPGSFDSGTVFIGVASSEVLFRVDDDAREGNVSSRVRLLGGGGAGDADG